MTDIIINLSWFSKYFALLPTSSHFLLPVRRLPGTRGKSFKTFMHMMDRQERSSQRGRQEEDVSSPPSFFTGSEDTEGHGPSKDHLLRTATHDSPMSTWLHNSSHKVEEVGGQNVAHLNWLTATCCCACSSPPNTERYCSLLTAAWHLPAEMVISYQLTLLMIM